MLRLGEEHFVVAGSVILLFRVSVERHLAVATSMALLGFHLKHTSSGVLFKTHILVFNPSEFDSEEKIPFVFLDGPNVHGTKFSILKLKSYMFLRIGQLPLYPT